MFDQWMMWNMGNMGMHGTGWFLWIALILVGLVFAMTTKTTWRSGESKTSALDILKRRFASGEISREEYRERKGELGGD